MKQKQTSPLLWRVDWTHKSGYQAPSQTIEFDPKQKNAKSKVIHLAKQQSRLGDFPEAWSCQVTNLAGLY